MQTTLFKRFVRCSVPLAVSGKFLFSSVAESSTQSPSRKFDLLVIGGGSGGLACAKRSAGYGANVGIVEYKPFGGTCVNVGCVPKKIMYTTSHVNETLHDAKHYGFEVKDVKFDWSKIKQSRDVYIGRLNRIYENGLDNAKVTRISGKAAFKNDKTVTVRTKDGKEETYSADHIVVAVGGSPRKLGVPGEEHVIDSDGFFALTEQPRRVAVLGAGYIAVELAGVFNGLGTETSLYVRGPRALREFDETISCHLHKSMIESGMHVHTEHTVKEVIKGADGTFSLHFTNGQVHGPFDKVLSAIGRVPATDCLDLDNAQVPTTRSGHIVVDDFQNTKASGVYALGDACGRVELTPMAVAAGRRLADRLFNNMPTAKADYNLVPTVVFSHPTIGTIGLTEKQAREEYPTDQLKVYNSSFVNLHYGPWYEGKPGPKPISKVKMICAGDDEKVVGLHMIGMGADEVLQGFGVAMKMGATKADFDSVVAIHPTAAEEIVTLPPWGMSGKK